MTAEFGKLPRLDLLYVREAFGHVQSRLARFDGDPSDFCLLVNECELVLKLHHDAVLLWPLNSLRDFPTEKITASHRETYRNLRRKYEAFLERYQAFGKKLNLTFERNVSQLYLGDLPEL